MTVKGLRKTKKYFVNSKKKLDKGRKKVLANASLFALKTATRKAGEGKYATGYLATTMVRYKLEKKNHTKYVIEPLAHYAFLHERGWKGGYVIPKGKTQGERLTKPLVNKSTGFFSWHAVTHPGYEGSYFMEETAKKTRKKFRVDVEVMVKSAIKG